jgi:hypothetical protein
MGSITWSTLFNPQFEPGGISAVNQNVSSILFDGFENYTSDANLTATWSIATNATATISAVADALKARQSIEVAISGGAGVIGRSIDSIPFDERVRYISFRGTITTGTDTIQVRLGNSGNTIYKEWDITVGTENLTEHIIDLYSGGNGYDNSEGFPGPSGTAGTWDENVVDTLSFRGLANSSTFRFDEVRFYYERSILEEIILGGLGAGGLSGDAVLWELSDYDDFDDADADADTSRWDAEYIANTDGTAAGSEGGSADINTTTSGQAFVQVDPDATPTQAAYAISRTLGSSSQYFTVIVDVDTSLNAGSATSTFSGLRISNGVADDAANYVIIAKETSSTVDRITTVAEFGGSRTTPINLNSADTSIAFKIERLFNVWNCYYSLTQSPSWEWVKLAQWEDASSNIGEITSVYLYSESGGSADGQIATSNFDNFKYLIRSGAIDDILERIGQNTSNNTYSSSNVGANVDGSVLERLESIQAALSVNAAAGGEFESDGSPDLWDALVVDSSSDASITTTTGDRDGAVIERLAALVASLGIVDAGTATGFEEDGTGGTLFESLVAAKGTLTTSSATVPADTGRTEADDYWNGDLLIPISGSVAWQSRVIVDFANAGGVFTIDSELPFTAATGTVDYVIVRNKHPLVPAADSTANQTPSHVIGNKSDAIPAMTATPGATDSVIQHIKAILERVGATPGDPDDSVLTNLGQRDDTATSDDLSDIATTSIEAKLRRLLLRFSSDAFSATVQGSARTDLETMVAQLATYLSSGGAAWSVTANPGGSAKDNLEETLEDLADMLAGATGIATYPSSAVPGNGVSIAEAIRQIYDDLVVVDGFHDVPSQDETANAQINEVLGNKTDTADYTSGATQSSVIRLVKGILGAQVIGEGTLTTDSATVPADTGRTEANDYWNGSYLMPLTGNVAFQPRLIVDFTTTTDVFTLDQEQPFTATPGLVDYVILSSNNQLVPAADGTNNSTPSHVIGNKADAAAAGDVTSTESVIAYLKQVVTEISGSDGITTFPAAAAYGNNISLAEVLAFIQDGVRNGSGTGLATNESLADVLYATNGILTYPSAAAPGNGVSLAEVIRSIYDRQLGDGTDTATNSKLGKKVTRGAADVFDGTTTALFTVSSGRIMLTHIEGEVTGAGLDGTGSNTKFVSNPTVGTDLDLCATLDIQSDELGSLYTITGVLSDALQGGTGGGSVGMTRSIIIPEGTIDLSSSADAGTGGAQGKFELWYFPMDDGASVAAA